MQGKRYAGIVAAVLSVLCLGLSGCGVQKANYEVTNLQVDKDGRITHTIVESFDKDFYSVEGLTAMISEEIAELHAEGKISLISAGIAENDVAKVVVVMQFAAGETYREYSGEEFFYGTVAAAKEAGYNLDIILQDSADAAKTIKSADGMESHHILITGESTEVNLPGKVLYYSEGVECIDSRTVRTTLPQEEDGNNQTMRLAYVITK